MSSNESHIRIAFQAGFIFALKDEKSSYEIEEKMKITPYPLSRR